MIDHPSMPLFEEKCSIAIKVGLFEIIFGRSLDIQVGQKLLVNLLKTIMFSSVLSAEFEIIQDKAMAINEKSFYIVWVFFCGPFRPEGIFWG